MKFRTLSMAVSAALLLGQTALAAKQSVPAFSLYDKTEFSTPGALSNAWADYDQDGDLDLVVTFKSGEIRLYRNENGKLTQVRDAPGLPSSGFDARGASWGDINNDGYPDLFTGSFHRPYHKYNQLFINHGGKSFEDVAEAYGVLLPGVTARQGNLIDYDNDGDLDLYLAQRMGGNHLYSNNGKGFTDVSKSAGLYDPRRSVGVCWFDYDKDGDLDMFVANQSGDRDGFYRNDEGKFTDIAAELNMDHPRRPLDEGGVGCTVGDFNNDGNFDLFVATYGDDLLYMNDGKGGFSEVAAKYGITGNHHHVSATWGDINNDGLLDLYVVGFKGTDPRQHDYLYINTGNGFVDMLPKNIAAQDADHGIQLVDFDGDGDIDISTTHNDLEVGHEFVYVNKLDPQGNYLTVAPVLKGSHIPLPGAEVRVFAGDELLGSRMVDTGGGYNAQNSAPVLIATPVADSVDLQVTFLTEQGRKEVFVPDVSTKTWKGKTLYVSQEGIE